MSFQACNGNRTKPLKPGEEFPIYQGNKMVAELVVAKNNLDFVSVRILVEGEVAVMKDGDTKLSLGDVTVDKKSFEIHSLKTDCAIRVTYEPEEEFTLADN